MHSNRYTLIYAAVLSILTAVILAAASEGLKPAQEANIALDTKSNILRAVRFSSDDRQAIEKEYGEHIREVVLNAAGEEQPGIRTTEVALKDEISKKPADRRLPLYIYTGKNGQRNYIIPVRGVGLWGPIWGYISLESDYNTVYGAFFDHKSETPGLGAEIAEAPFQQQFQGKKIRDDNDRFVSVNVVKKTDKISVGNEHRVDAISGGTITSRGTDAMLKNCLAPYLTYFEKQKSNVL
ncbi:NADH:ubiquinone reductase (Na(+)-transporting) subunit C [Larkinella punicea]|uniref:Na(+)-translocating NADH-quinone reductase subunit C n=1 Tax=Larkinella punicea TaxID=2315727 RepID=A0A368JW14_9BACT|nr:NADH:ubiquinone reductase (Na(+)-transporting) subunit C [Larkinella punicea]RCR70783.1 NADH:ubiquinone reductase (Na(+)-transporting) subunit C [Larkinella punicea]